jgi:hypothetical protein
VRCHRRFTGCGLDDMDLSTRAPDHPLRLECLSSPDAHRPRFNVDRIGSRPTTRPTNQDCRENLHRSLYPTFSNNVFFTATIHPRLGLRPLFARIAKRAFHTRSESFSPNGRDRTADFVLLFSRKIIWLRLPLRPVYSRLRAQ